MRKRIVLDTNIFSDYLCNFGEGRQVVFRIMEKCTELEIATCDKMLSELRNNLIYSRNIPSRYTDHLLRTIIPALEKLNNKLQIYEYQPYELEFEMNHKDQYICEFAVRIQAHYLISNDYHHFIPIREDMSSLYNISVVTSQGFLSLEGDVENWSEFESIPS